MKQTIDYTNLNEPAKRAKALDDIKFYLGDGYDRICRELKEVKHFESFAFALSFAGIQGYPVKALYNHIHGGDNELV